MLLGVVDARADEEACWTVLETPVFTETLDVDSLAPTLLDDEREDVDIPSLKKMLEDEREDPDIGAVLLETELDTDPEFVGRVLD